MKEIVKHFLFVSDRSYFEYFKEKVSLLPNIDDIFAGIEKEIGTTIDADAKDKYKNWYQKNKEKLNNIICEFELESSRVVK